MNCILKVTVQLLIVCALVSAMVSVSHALSYTYATDVRWDNGSGAPPSNTPYSRFNQVSALGSPDVTTTDNTHFLSLGLGGLAVFDFGVEFDAGAIVFETTYGDRTYWPEFAKIYVADSTYNFAGLNSNNGAATISPAGFTFVGAIDNLHPSIVIDLSALTGPFRYILIQDTTPTWSRSYEGFDVDAIGVIGVAPVPEPCTMMLLGLGMAGLAIYSKRRQNNKV